MITETQYQQMLEPFRNAHVMFPGTLDKFYEFTRNERFDDIPDYIEMLSIFKWLLGINWTIYPKECQAIVNELKGYLDPASCQ